jgi:cyclopropane fatty-acyl-phospholipid synthase-like methyltransferase
VQQEATVDQTPDTVGSALQEATGNTARQAVSRYYDRNTKAFLATGEGGKSLAIHRGIWCAGTASATQAAEHVPALMLEQARETGARHILDLGCGVGGTCLYLAQGLGLAPAPLRTDPLRITGMTISGAQLRLGCSLVKQRGLEAVVSLLRGDYTKPASFAGLPPQDLVVALESFLHSPDLDATLANATAVLRPGGRLVICDDMMVTDPGPAARGCTRDLAERHRAERDLADFRRCWHAYGLVSRDEMARLCQGLGLQLLFEEDLSPLLHLFRPRDRLAAFFLPVLRFFRNWPRAQNLVGGTALQRLLARGVLAYRYQVWVKPA